MSQNDLVLSHNATHLHAAGSMRRYDGSVESDDERNIWRNHGDGDDDIED